MAMQSKCGYSSERWTGAFRSTSNEVVVGEWAWSTRSICGTDNRIASAEPRVGRIDPIGCTGWIASNGKYLSAGHCLAGGSSNSILSFNPPASLPDGTVQFPGPEDQYSIDQSSFQFTNGGVGNDWGIFRVFNNNQSGLQPIEAQGSFNVRQDFGPANIRITGFGVDSGTTNQTNQTHAGPNTGSSGTTMRYATDTTGGNSGSPVIDEATGEAVGIHTHGGCSASGGNNSGTSFFNDPLWTALDATGGPPPPPPGVDCPAGTIDFDTFALTSYSNQNASNNVAVEDGGDILLLTANTWVRSTQSFTITPSTVIDFQFASEAQGEIHAIGFDEDDTLNNALFTQPNTGGAGTNDVDGGECIATSPIYSVSAASDVSIWYFHGQRDAGDDPTGDFFALERSIDGGTFQPMVSIGDSTSNAAWTEATATAGAGSTIQFRVRASDGAGPGDLVEAGVDNLTVCAQ